ncbi:MAG: SDR family NAD(P)-dependent oxidoreductase [Acidimicrobiia bacterium]
MTFDLSTKVALVTGATAGIGKACALALARAGADVAVTGRRNLEAGAEMVAEIEALGRKAIFIAADVRDADAVDQMVDRVVCELGGLHIAVNNALTQVGGGDLFGDRAVDAWMRSMDAFITAPFLCCRAEGAHMAANGGGSIINIASVLARVINRGPTSTGVVAYATAKAAIVHMTKALATNWAPMNIRVNSVSPGFVRTAATVYLEQMPEERLRLEGNTPLGRIAEPDEIGGAVVYLASDASSFTTGSDLLIDGGYSIW